MATQSFEDLADTFEFLDDWEDRYRHVIELGRAMPPLDDAFKVPALKVQGCASQVWLRPLVGGGRFDFQGDSDAMIVRGLIAILHHLYAGLTLDEVRAVDAPAELAAVFDIRPMSDLPKLATQLLDGQLRGRIVIDVNR